MNKYLVEFLGTMFFIYIIIATQNPLAIGAALTIAIMLSKNISGGNFNPALTIALTKANKVSYSDVIPYILSIDKPSIVDPFPKNYVWIDELNIKPTDDAFDYDKLASKFENCMVGGNKKTLNKYQLSWGLSFIPSL